MYQLCVYIPESHLEAVKRALFAAGAGKIGQYDNCCWQILGEGQFRPLSGSSPFLGVKGEIESVNEYKVEMVLEDAVLADVVAALKFAHPYEEPAYTVISLVDTIFL